jgi:hypothetical protein
MAFGKLDGYMYIQCTDAYLMARPPWISETSQIGAPTWSEDDYPGLPALASLLVSQAVHAFG